MGSNRDREAAVERLLREAWRNEKARGPSEACLDAETLAAWAEGTLPREAAAAAEEHVADCSRCLALVAAISQSTPIDVAPAGWWARVGPARWIVPLAAAATAVAIWVAVPSDQRQAATGPAAPVEEVRTAPQAAEVPAPAPQAAPAPAGAEGTRAETRPSTPEAGFSPASRSLAIETPSASAPARRAAAEAEAGMREVPSPDPAVRWRIGPAGLIERSGDAGASWVGSTSGVSADLTAGASPSPSVCWVVGRAGTVLLTTDGETWRQLAVPASVDLAAVRATDARRAVVTAADGRTFTTTDGGVTWSATP